MNTRESVYDQASQVHGNFVWPSSVVSWEYRICRFWVRCFSINSIQELEQRLPLSPPSILAPMLRPLLGALFIPPWVRRSEGATWEPVLKEEIQVNPAHGICMQILHCFWSIQCYSIARHYLPKSPTIEAKLFESCHYTPVTVVCSLCSITSQPRAPKRTIYMHIWQSTTHWQSSRLRNRREGPPAFHANWMGENKKNQQLPTSILVHLCIVHL